MDDASCNVAADDQCIVVREVTKLHIVMGENNWHMGPWCSNVISLDSDMCNLPQPGASGNREYVLRCIAAFGLLSFVSFFGLSFIMEWLLL